MSVSKWNWKEICDTRPCSGDCDLCGYEDEMIYIIMCGGKYHNWQKPRQLTEVNSEPLIVRTVRLLKENGIEPYISSNDPIFEEFAPVLYHSNRYEGYKNGGNNGRWTDCFYPTDQPACYIFGDVLFSPEAIKTIVETPTDDIEFFASAEPFAVNYPKPWAEPFAFKVACQGHLKSAIAQTETLASRGAFKRAPIAWELWQVIKGTPLNRIIKNYTTINDYTCDVDSPEDLKRIEQNVPHTVSYEEICK